MSKDVQPKVGEVWKSTDTDPAHDRVRIDVVEFVAVGNDGYFMVRYTCIDCSSEDWSPLDWFLEDHVLA